MCYRAKDSFPAATVGPVFTLGGPRTPGGSALLNGTRQSPPAQRPAATDSAPERKPVAASYSIATIRAHWYRQRSTDRTHVIDCLLDSTRGDADRRHHRLHRSARRERTWRSVGLVRATRAHHDRCGGGSGADRQAHKGEAGSIPNVKRDQVGRVSRRAGLPSNPRRKSLLLRVRPRSSKMTACRGDGAGEAGGVFPADSLNP
jgi:hypothetical protein